MPAHRPRSLLLLVLVLMALTSACGSPEAADEVGAVGQAVDGEALFQANCARCHGADLEGTRFGPPFLDPIYRPDHHADEAFLLAVRNGVRAHHWEFGDMPAIPGLNTEQVQAITQYVRDQQRAAGLLG